MSLKRQSRTKRGVSTKASIYRSFGAQIFHLLNSKNDDQSLATTFERKTEACNSKETACLRAMAMQMKTKTLRQSVLLKAIPHEVYEALMDSKKHAEFTHSPAVIRKEVGAEFSTFDGWASGTTLELIPDKKIVQKWRAAEWPEGHYSTVTFELQAQGQETRLDFTQSDIPEGLYEELEAGWVEYYWDNLEAYFG